MTKLRAKIAQWDDEIRRGKAGAVRRGLTLVSRAAIPRESFADLAAICRRSDFVEFGLKLLNPVIRATKQGGSPATETERAEYAALLIRIGAGDEAIQLLSQLDANQNPQVLLYLSYALISQWNYGDTIPVLERYLKMPGNEPYFRLIAQVNLAASYVWEKPRNSIRPMLTSVLAEAKQQGLGLIQGNCLELLAQSAILRGELPEAAHWLSEAKRSLATHGGRDEFFVRKWQVFLLLHQFGFQASVKRAITQLAEEARRREHWETLRQADLYVAAIRRDPVLFEKLYFGTPFPAFRDRVVRLWQPKAIPTAYERQLGEAKKAATLDFSALLRETSAGDVNPLLVKSLFALTSDFYRPLRIPTLFYALYPKEFYHPVHSPQRIHFAVKQLRAWLKKKRVPLQISASKNGYELTTASAIRLTIPAGRYEVDPVRDKLKTLHDIYGTQIFSAEQAASSLDLPLRTTHRFLAQGVTTNLLIKIGSGRATRYRLVKGDLGDA